MSAEQDYIYDEYINRIGELLNGNIKRFDRGTMIIAVDKTEMLVPRSEQSRHEKYDQGERFKGVITEVTKNPKGTQVVLSRTSPELLKRLFEAEVPEIKTGQVVIKSAVREPGEMAKIAVQGTDAVNACTGTKGSRVQAIIRELRGEKIDIVLWSDDLKTFITNALAPAVIKQIKLLPGEGRQKTEVIVADDQLSTAIGKRGQNVRLAAALTGCAIDVKSENEL